MTEQIKIKKRAVRRGDDGYLFSLELCFYYTVMIYIKSILILEKRKKRERNFPLPPCVYFLMISLSFSAAVETASLTTAAALFALAAAFSRAISLAK